MEMNNLRLESHVAQKSRRDKLRIQQNSDPNHHLEEYTNHLGQFPVHRTTVTSKYGSLPYDPNVFPSDMLNCVARNSQLLLPESLVARHESGSSQPNRPNSDSLPNPQNSSNWKSAIGNSQQICDWTVSYPNGIDQSNLNPMFVGEGLSSSLALNTIISSSSFHMKPSSYGYPQDVVQSSLTIPSRELLGHQNGQRHHGEMHFGSSPIYHNTLQEVFTSATIGTQGLEMTSLANDNCNSTQALSLSLSSVPPTKDGSQALYSEKRNENARQSMTGISAFTHRNVGPLGPFTGYATILKNSKYLKTAQQILNESCNVSGDQDQLIQTSEVFSQKIPEECTRVSCDSFSIGAESLDRAKSGDSGASSSILYGSNERINIEAGGQSSSTESYRPEFQQKKVKLLYMQEEVCRRYKQYHQQMQMVISSFETVAGLSAATPYVSLALKMVSKHFRCVKNAIAEQLTQTRKALGEDLSSPTTGASSSKAGDTTTTSTSSRLRFMDNNFQKLNRSDGGFFGPQQPTWRPQKGLPERAVSILKAWLFDHFLHPYPSDTDKHMLATQTGLTRNQVSNWFINARVRIWKPMVEEIHTLETKGGLTESNSNNHLNNSQHANRLGSTSVSNKQPECSLAGMEGHEPQHIELWDRDKQSRVDQHQIAAGMDGSLMGIVPYQRNGGLGSVSLTLGLRQSAEQLQQQENQLRQHFGGQLIHDFVG